MSAQRRTRRRWIVGALIPFALLVGLRGLSRTDLFRDGPWGKWYILVGVGAVMLLACEAVVALVGRAYRPDPGAEQHGEQVVAGGPVAAGPGSRDITGTGRAQRPERGGPGLPQT